MKKILALLLCLLLVAAVFAGCKAKTAPKAPAKTEEPEDTEAAETAKRIEIGAPATEPAPAPEPEPEPAPAPAPETDAPETAPVETEPVETELETEPVETEPETEPVETKPVETEPQPKPTEPEPTEPEPPATEFEPSEGAPMVTAAECIRESFVAEGSYTDEWGYEYEYSYHIPQFTSDSTDAMDLNSYIHREFQTMAEEALESIKSDGYAFTFGISWEFYGHGEWFDLVISCFNDWDQNTYHTLHFNQITGEMMTNEDVLAFFGLTMDEFIKEGRTFIRNKFNEDYGHLRNSEYAGEEMYDEILEATVSDLDEYTSIYIDNSWGLWAVINWGSFAGAASYQHRILMQQG